MPKVGILINGNKIFAEEGSNLLEIATTSGIEIPHLCYDPRIKPFGSCRMCFVEVAGGRGPVPACATIVKEGMEVVTDNDVLRGLRQVGLELLMSEHCGDCIAPCQLACPAEIDIQGFIAHIANGQTQKAGELIKEKMPLPSVCGRVCPRFCEMECRRNVVDDPVDICGLKRFVGDFDLEVINSYEPKVKTASGYKVAVVGGGPAGLTAAYYLALEGHGVTLFDRGPKLGGMLRYGIPEYRLPKELLDKEINLITDLCEDVHLGKVLGQDFTLDELKEKYDAVFLGVGSQKAQGMGLEKEDNPGVLRGIDFLRDVVEGNPLELGNKVAVIGGGNTAMDAARTSLRLGAKEVTVVYRRTRDEMPANPEEIKEAEEEGVKFNYLTNPVAILPGEKCLEGMECIRMVLGEPDSSGRRRPIAVKGSEFKLEVDTVIMAIGQALEKEKVAEWGVELCNRGNVKACNDTACTPIEGVFSAGDGVTGPATVVEAVGGARRGARAIDLYLRGEEITPEVKPFNCSMGELKDIKPEDFADKEKLPRAHASHLAPEERAKHFKEFNLGLNKEGVQQETNRCLSCGCQDVFDCTLRKMASDCGLSTERLGVSEKRYPINDKHRYIHHDPNKCVLCGNCVRICEEVQGISALGFVNRGYDTVVKPALELPLAETLCESCSQCVSTCPTGAMSQSSTLPKPGPFEIDRVVDSACVQCGIGCSLELHVVGDKIAKVTSPLRGEVNDGNLCKKGAFEYSFIHDKGRLKSPLVKDNGEMKEVPWEKALGLAGGVLKKIRDRQGSESLAVLVSPQLSNEENYLAQKLARGALRTNNIDSTKPVFGGFLREFTSPEATSLTYENVAQSDFILVINTDLTMDYPIVAHKIRKALDRGGKLAILSQQATRMDKSAAVTVRIKPRKTFQLLRAFQGYLYRYGLVEAGFEPNMTNEEIKHALLDLPEAVRVKTTKVIDLIHMYLRSKNPVVIVDGETLGGQELKIIEDIIRITGNLGPARGILPLYRAGNARGQLDMGVNPKLLPGRKSIDDLETRERYCSTIESPLPLYAGRDQAQILEGVGNGDIMGVVIIGDDMKLDSELFDESVFTVVITSTWRKDLSNADVVLPGSVFAEVCGTITNCEGRLQKLNPAIKPAGGKESREVIAELAEILGNPIKSKTSAEILKEVEIIADWYLSQEGDFFLEGELFNKEDKEELVYVSF